MSSVSNGHQDVDIDLAQLFRAVWKRKARILAATALVGCLAFVGASMMSPKYSSEARILIEPREPNFTTQTNVQAPTEPLSDELNIVSQVQLLQSVDLIKQVARDLKLYELEEFDPDTNPSAVSDLLVMLGLKKNPLDMAPEERVLKAFQEKLQVYQVEKSRVIGIQFTSKDPKLAAEVPNAMANVYRSLQSGAKLDSNSEAARWLEPEIANLREKVREAENKVAEYRGNADLMQVSETTSFSSQQLSDISAELARVRGERADAEAKAENVRNAIKAGKSTDTLVAITGNEAIQRLKASESEIRGKIADLSTTLLDGHPQMKALRSQLVGIREQITSESTKIAAGLENDANVARSRETQLIQQLNTVKADSARAGTDEVGLKALEREATAQRQLLETYLARYREATTRLDKGASPADARVISSAVEPHEASFPKVIPITIVAALATFVLSAVIVMLSELFSGRALRPVGPVLRGEGQEPHRDGAIETANERSAPAVAAPRAIASVPAATIPASLLSVQPDEDLADAMEETLELERPPRTEALEARDEFSIESVADYLIESRARIAFAISPSGDDGSTATVMLAREFDERGRKVVLIDMTGSACPTWLMAARKDLPGITDLLCGEAPFSETIHPDRLSGADVIPQGNSDVRQAMRGADRLSMIADALADAYDLVLVECGPANAESVARLSRNGAHEIILSAPKPDEQELVEIMAAFEKVGYSDLVLMSGGGNRQRKAAKRSAA
ncbi:chain-length determining protein [Rhizobium sp. KAs_5_22]|uniref:exopolysaccharide transport family protein n=1 Tax=Ciceribacter selenitireducens TaxID=448181 RepID=UPI00048DD8D3|nr:exopolysaccharide transport family protein [Ciceribacter selenitireducens]PPJ46994.1 chain-length determining protein [Rhizobium sp. KAs_5_22]